MAKVIYLEDIVNKRYKEAYDWALSDSKNRGIIPSPVTLCWNEGEDYDRKRLLATIFYDPESGDALIRRDWLKKPLMQYNLITNFDEVKKTAPNAINEMLEAGLRLQERLSYYN